jgi:hypothetical protein
VRSFALLALLLGGCDMLFDLTTVNPNPDGPVYDRCAPGGYDDPLRYNYVLTDTIGSTTWDDARRNCQLRGMDLAVFNDNHEMGMAPEAQWPYWFGVKSDATGWSTIDGCPAIGMPTPSIALGSADPMCGAMFSPLTPNGSTCDGALVQTPPDGPDHVLGVLCETPRPKSAACLPKDPTLETYTVSPTPMAYDAAKKFCEDLGDHLVVVDSHAELMMMSRLVSHGNIGAGFWFGATFDGTWKSVTTCPAEFSWTDLGPSFIGDPFPNCVSGVLAMDLESNTMALQGMALASCGDPTKLAVCESD